MGSKNNSFFTDTRAADTIPLKMVFYLAITCAVIILTAFAWNSLSPVYSASKDSKQINDAILQIQSIQGGYARNLPEPDSPEGSTCTIEISLPHVTFLAFGVDPDPDMDGDLGNTDWVQENNTIICQYENGARDRYPLDSDDSIMFRNGIFDNTTGRWKPDNNLDNNRNLGVVIEEPVEGNFNFELVFEDQKYTLSHF